MKRFLWLLLAVFLLPIASRAQNFTQVTVCVTDSSNLPYSYGTISAVLTPSVPGGYTLGGQPYSGQLSYTSLDVNGCANGASGIQMGSNAAILPAGSQWLFTVGAAGMAAPLGTGAQSFNVTISISGASQTISTTVSAAAPALTRIPIGSKVSPLNTFSFSKTCSTGDPLCFQVTDDGQQIFDAGFTALSGTVTSSAGDPPFVPSDVGKFEEGFFNCNNLNDSSQCHSNCSPGTITAFVSSHQVTVSPVCTNNSSVAANSNNFIWGTDDCTPLTNGFKVARAQTLHTPTALNYPGGMMIETCSALQDTVGANYAFGLSHYGHGTMILVSQNAPCNTPNILAHGCMLDLSFTADQLGQVGSGDFAQDLMFSCGGSDVPGTGTYTNPSDGVFVGLLSMAVNVGVLGCNWNKSTAAPFYAGSINGGSWVNPGNNATGFGVHLSSFNGSPANVAFGTLGGGFGNAAVCDAAGSQVNTRGVYFNQSAGPLFSSKFAYAIRNAGCKWVDYGSTDANEWSDSASADTTFVGTQLSGFGAINDLVLPSGKISLTSRTTLSGNVNLTGGTLFVDTSSTWPPPSGFSPAAPSGVTLLTGTQVGSDFQLAKTTAQAAKTVYTVGGNTESFQVSITISCDSASAGATVTPSILYTDASNTAVTVTGTGAVCTALGSASNVSFVQTVRAKNATAIQYSTAIANTPTYDITVGVQPSSLF